MSLSVKKLKKCGYAFKNSILFEGYKVKKVVILKY
jgi:hypothetical protein